MATNEGCDKSIVMGHRTASYDELLAGMVTLHRTRSRPFISVILARSCSLYFTLVARASPVVFRHIPSLSRATFDLAKRFDTYTVSVEVLEEQLCRKDKTP
eukprot:739081-Hanusia_phi.AAC.3